MPRTAKRVGHSTSAARMRLLRQRRHRGVRCLTIEFGPGSELGPIIHALASRNPRNLPREAQNDPAAVLEALYAYLYRALGIRRPPRT